MHKRVKIGISAIVALAYLWTSYPYFDAYLQVPNRFFQTWDPAIHFKDGITFYLQAVRFDLVSFIYTLFNLSFWMPLHPLLVAFTSVFFPFNADAVVYLNFLVLAASLGFCSYLCLIAKSLSKLQSAVLTLNLFYLVARLGNAPVFWDTHLNIMIESLALGVTLIFLMASLLEEIDSDRSFFQSVSIASLTLLLFTKIQYGLFYGLAYFAKIAWFERSLLFGREGYFSSAAQVIVRSKLIIFATSAILIFGIFAFTQKNFPNGLWSCGFSVVLLSTYLRFSKRTESTDLRRSMPIGYRRFNQWIILLFGWYYLFPLRQKMRWLLYNASSNSQEKLIEKLTSLPNDFAVYFNLSQPIALCAIAVTLFALLISASFSKKLRVASLYSLGLLLSFYLPMSLFAGARITRLSLTWVAIFPIIISVLAVFGLPKKLNQPLYALLLLLSCGIWFECHSISPVQTRDYLESSQFLSPDHQHIAQALSNFDFSRPGIIYGLGQTMDLATILFDLRVLREHPEYTSVFSKREERDLVTNDFGKIENRTPVDFILKKAGEGPSGAFYQLMLFKSGFDHSVLQNLTSVLISPQFKYTIPVENKSFLYFRKALTQ